jgi:hypothetical protein
MKTSIQSGSLDLRDKKKEKALEKIDMITQENLTNLIKEHDQLKNQEQEIETQITENNVLQKTKETELKLANLNKQQTSTETNLSTLKKHKEKINTESLKTELEQDIRTITNIEINLLL